jgi:hypothetical protein
MARWLRAREVFITAALLCYRAPAATAFPVYVAPNGTTVVNSAFGSNLVLGPDAGGANGCACMTFNHLQLERSRPWSAGQIVASTGILLNSTLLNDAVIQGLLSQVRQLQSQLAPNCTSLGGSLQRNGASWACVCNPGFSGSDCSIPPAFGATCSSTTNHWPLNSTIPTADVVGGASAVTTGSPVAFSNGYNAGIQYSYGGTLSVKFPDFPLSFPLTYSWWMMYSRTTYCSNPLVWRNNDPYYISRGAGSSIPTGTFFSIGTYCVGGGSPPTVNLFGAGTCSFEQVFGPPFGVWNHWVMTIDSNIMMKMYLNGSPLNVTGSSGGTDVTGTSCNPLNGNPSITSWLIGMTNHGTYTLALFGLQPYPNGLPYFGSGSTLPPVAISNFQMMNTALSATAVKNLYMGSAC